MKEIHLDSRCVVSKGIAYHGGTEAVTAPEIRERLHAPDFGTGFYTMSSEEQADIKRYGSSRQAFTRRMRQ